MPLIGSANCWQMETLREAPTRAVPKLRNYPFNMTNLLYRDSMLTLFSEGEDDAKTQSRNPELV